MSESSTSNELPASISSLAGSTTGQQIPRKWNEPSSGLAFVLPPFRSATEFPRAPKSQQLPSLYVDCFQALQDANTARRTHKRRMDARKQVIQAVRLEIARVEQDFALEAATRARLHSMNFRLLSALQEMDDLAGDMYEVVHAAHRVPRGKLGRLIESIKALIHQWRSLKRRQREEMASLTSTEHYGEQ